jgi:L-ascorbate metabolism protein UlaG (beta-lactamase superfamily)
MLRRVAKLSFGSAVAAASLVVGIGAWLSGPGHRGPPTDHFDGARFHNGEPTELPGFRRALRMLTEPRGPAWTERAVAPQPPPPSRVSGEGMRVTFVNHATALVQHDGLNVLTDPIWSDRCSPVPWAGPRRHHEPGVAIADLPKIDLILVSHNHYDHLDLGTLRTLARRDDPTLIVPLGNGRLVSGLGFSRVIELDWDQAVEVGPARVIGQEVRHFSSRGLFDQQKTLWMGFVVDAPAGRWVFAGDTGFGGHFAATGAAHGPFRLALLPIGAYAPRWFMSPIHMDPADAVRAHQALGAQFSVGVHHGTFRLTNEAQDAPKDELAQALAVAGLPPEAFVALAPGEGRDVPSP